MDAGTIAIMNKIAAKGPLLPKNLRMIFKGAEVIAEDEDATEEPELLEESIKTIVDSGTELPSGIVAEETIIDRGDDDIVESNEVVVPITGSTEQLEELEVGRSESPAADRTDLPEDAAVRPKTAEEEEAYHRPPATEPAFRQIPESPWFLSGKPIEASPDGMRPKRERRPVDRYAAICEELAMHLGDTQIQLCGSRSASQT
jgi:hypothetical protein